MADPFEISRVARTKQQAASAYDRLSRWYDRLSAGGEWGLVELGLKKINVGMGETVLEIGCGTGNALLTLAAVLQPGRVVGVDISRGMLGVADRRITKARFRQCVDLLQGDAVVLPLKTDAFDAIFISFTLELFDTPEIAAVLGECRRVLKSDGRVCVVAMTRDEHENLAQRIYEGFHRFLPAIVDCRPIFVRSSIALAGFQVEDCTRRYLWGLPVDIAVGRNP